MKKIQISPSILSADFSQLGSEIKKLEEGGADLIHVDVMDGHFVPNITFGPAMCKAIRPHIKTVMDVHLMISPVDNYVEDFVNSGADIITAHVEATPHIHRTIQLIKSYGIKAGVALNPSTPVENIEYVLDIIDLVCVMTVNPGFGGQKFINSQVEKVSKLRSMIGELPIHIEIDGGITPTTAPLVAKAGADVLVAGSGVFSGGSVNNPANYGENINSIRLAAEQSLK